MAKIRNNYELRNTRGKIRITKYELRNTNDGSSRTGGEWEGWELWERWERWEGMGGDGREYLGGTLKVSEGGGSNGSNGREETPMDCTDKTDFDAF